jgi:hypothetical protein
MAGTICDAIGRAMCKSALILAVACSLGCGGAQKQDPDQRCSDQPIDPGTGLAQMVACPFEQQLYNIFQHGTDVAGATVTAGGMRSVGTAVRRCGRYLEATDAQDQTIVIDTRSGAVTSHGATHAGYPKSALSDRLPLPISF